MRACEYVCVRRRAHTCNRRNQYHGDDTFLFFLSFFLGGGLGGRLGLTLVHELETCVTGSTSVSPPPPTHPPTLVSLLSPPSPLVLCLCRCAYLHVPPPCHGSNLPFENTMLVASLIRLPPSMTLAHSGRGVTPHWSWHPLLESSMFHLLQSSFGLNVPGMQWWW